MTLEFPGYNETFLGPTVALPQLSAAQRGDLLFRADGLSAVLPHANYSVVLSASRRLAFFSAANVDGALYQEINRSDLTNYWRREAGIAKIALTGHGWYRASLKKLQRGHLTPADCMEWGVDRPTAILNANNTFFFSNAVPQIQRLNGTEWSMLERFIAGENSKTSNQKLCVITGPALLSDDPLYVYTENNQTLYIPRFFWKVVYYLNRQGELCRIAFVMGQEELLNESQLIVTTDKVSRFAPPQLEDPFTNLGKYKTYQVPVRQIEATTGLGFAPAKDTYQEPERRLIQQAPRAKARGKRGAKGPAEKYQLEGMVV